MEVYAETKNMVVNLYMEHVCSPKGWYLVRDFVNYASLYRYLTSDGSIKDLGRGNYRFKF